MRPGSRHRRTIAAAALGAAGWLFAASAAQAGDDPPGSDRGRLESATFLNHIDADAIAHAIAAAGPKAPAASPRYDVINHRLTYRTLDARGRPIVASGLVSVPLKPAGAPSPVLGYQHGTLFKDAQAPSNHAVAAEPAVVMASLGYLVVAADYVGYGVSRGAPHPYLMAEPSAAAVIDLLTAAQAWRRREGVADNGQLFLTGYSEGAYVTLATHRALQAADSPQPGQLVASVAGGGPYHLGATVGAQLRRVRERHPILGAIFRPELLRLVGTTLRREARRLLVRQLVPARADVRLQTRFLDLHFAGDEAALDRLANVHDWKPDAPVSLFHGHDDRTVPHESALRALHAMRARGAANVSLTDCPAAPSSHRNCVAPYWSFMLGQFGALARDR